MKPPHTGTGRKTNKQRKADRKAKLHKVSGANAFQKFCRQWDELRGRTPQTHYPRAF